MLESESVPTVIVSPISRIREIGGNALWMNMLERGQTATNGCDSTLLAAAAPLRSRQTSCTSRTFPSTGTGSAFPRISRKYSSDEVPVTGGVLIPDLRRFSHMGPLPFLTIRSSSCDSSE